MSFFRRDIFLYTAPFVTWIALQSILPVTAWAYAVRTFATATVGLAAALAARRMPQASPAVLTPIDVPPARRMRQVLFGVAIGVAVAALWIFPDRFDWYRCWLCWPLGKLPPPATSPSPYDPAVCGWPLTLMKLIGSAFVIAPAEELFFRSFLYRWLQHRNFTTVKLSHFDLSAFLWTIFLFSLEHDRPLAAVMAGAAYGLTAIRWGLFAAIVAHVVTNLLLALYVIHFAEWCFW